MGKATRWLKGLFKLTRKKSRLRNSDNWTPVKIDSDEQCKHAMAITAAAADAAVAVAQAAMALVRLTGHSNRAVLSGAREKWAATLIQSIFRGYLVSIYSVFFATANLVFIWRWDSQARKALRALKGLVKLQALVRGYIVRKRTAENLRRLEALIFHGHRTRTCCMSHHCSPSSTSMEKDEEFRGLPPFNSPLHVFRCGSPRVDYESRRRRIRIPDYGDDSWYQKPSSFSCRIPANCDSRHFQTLKLGLEDDCGKFPTAQTTPRFSGWANSPVTQSRSVCGDGEILFGIGASPNYMVDTQSFQAKLRSKSAPKLRPESKRKLSFMASRTIFNGARFRRAPFHQVER